MKLRDLLGKEARSTEFGRVTIISVPKKARANVEIRVLQRGRGWDDITETYKPVRTVYLNPNECPGARTITWRTTHRDEYGHTEIVNIKTLEI